MMTKIAIVAIWLVLQPGVAQIAGPRPNCHTPTQCEERIIQAELTPNSATFQDLLSDMLIAIGPDGQRRHKQEMMKILASTPAQQLTASDFVETPAGRDAVIVSYGVKVRTPDGMKAHTASSVWVRSHHHWRMVFHQGTSVSN